MLKRISKRLLSLLLAVVMVISMIPVTTPHAHAASGSLTMTAEGLTASYSGDGTWSGGGTTASGSVTGKKVIWSSAQSATLTLTNSRAKTAMLSFSYNITKNTGSVTIGGTTVTGSGAYEGELEAGDYIQVVITSGKGTSNTTAIDLSDISLVVDSSATTTFQVAEGGSYTVNGTAITADTQLVQSSTVAYTLAATAAAGYSFVGWYSTDINGYVGYNANASINVENDTTIYPVFVSETTPVFQVGTERYLDFAEAEAAAEADSSKQMTLVKSGTLGAGTYELSAGVKLLIPFSAAYTADFDDTPTYVNASNGGSYTTPSMYMNLTLAEGAVLNCYGSINANGQMLLNSGNYASQVTGTYGALDLLAGSKLNLESGSALYAYGYVGGEGTVEAKPGSKIYQMMQINDWRGGQASSSLSGTMKNNSFLFSQYYLQNVEANQVIHYGSTVYAVVGMTANAYIGYAEEQITAPIIGATEGLFRLGKSGDYITMKYDAASDRMNIGLYGDISTVSINLSMRLGIYNFDMNTSEYILPIPGNFTLTVASGSNASFTEKIKLLPGTEVYVEEGATVTVGANGAVYLYDHDDWNSGTYTYGKTIFQLRYVHARKTVPVTRTVSSDAVLNVNGSLVAYGPIYSTKQVEAGGNAGITGSGTVQISTHGSTDLIEIADSSTSPSTTTIACVPAVAVVAGHEGLNSLDTATYKSTDGQWYQYTLTAEGVTVDSGVYTAEDGTMYVGNIKDTPASVTVTQTDAENLPCVTAVNAAITKNEDGTYTVSGFTSNANIKATAHTPETVEEKAPTCTEEGLTAGEICSACGEILTAQETVDALGHTEVVLEAKAPTCTATGLTEGKQCSVCGEITVAQEIVAALGHTEEIVPGYASTCTEDGLSNGKKCTVCGAVTEEQVVIEAAGHTYEVAVTAPTCTEQGYTTNTCHCGDSYVDAYVDALGHTYEEVVAGTYVAPTCTTDGKESTLKCVRCDATQEGAVIEATGHDHSIAVEGSAKEPTCTENGKEMDLKCANCDDVLSGATIPATGHTYSVAVEGSAKAPTCTQPGKELDFQCHSCDAVLAGATIPATGHEEVLDLAVAATCTATGLTEGKHCETCGEVLVAQQTVAALGHAYVAVVTAPTCTDKGYTTHTCSRCGDSYVDSYTESKEENHSYDSVTTVAPTCTEDGYDANVCSICGHLEKIAGTEVEAAGHFYEYSVLTPTCTEGGYTVRTCLDCDYTDKVEFVDPLGHDCVGTVTAPTCTEQGYTTHNCSRCNYSHIPADSYVDALGHDCVATLTYPTCTEQGYTTHDCSRCDYSHIPADSYTQALGHQFELALKSPTCLEGGYTVATCMDCGHEYINEQTYTEAAGHKYESAVTTAPTCTENGVLTYTCEGCEDTYTEQIPAAGHAYDAGVVTEPKCHEEGYTTYTCASCGHSYTDNHVTALGCEFGEWEITTAPTCTEDGEQKRTCIRCDHFETETVPATGHLYTSVVTPPTCTEQGYATFTCACGDSYEDNYVEANGHVVVVDAAVAATCTATGLTEGSHCSVCDEVLVEQEEVAMLEHTYSDWSVSKVASCLEEGEEIRSCSVCFAQETRATAKQAHTPMTDYGTAARYDKPGKTEGSHCSACNTVLVAQQDIPMLVLEWDTFLLSLQALEQYAIEYAASNPGKDPVKLMINFVRTGVERYNDDEWVTMAGAAETVFINEVLAKDDINGTHAYALRHLVNITMPNGEEMEFGHLFGALNVSSNNKYTQSYGDFGSWAGDLCDLLEYSYENGVAATELEAMVAEVDEKYFGTDDENASGFGAHDVKADLDAYYIVSKITAGETSLYKIFEEYYTASLTDRQRAAYFLNNRFAGSMTQEAVRESVHTTYKNHLLVQLLESGRGIADQDLLREACCYTFADYLYNLAKDDLVEPETPDDTPEEDPNSPDVYKVFNSTDSTLAPGVSQNISYAIDSNGKQMVFYMATVDITRDDVNIYANYANNDPSKGWAMATVSAQMQAAQDKHSNPDDAENYIPNYNVVVGQNANFYNMSTGEPSGLFVMGGVTYTTGRNFFAILKDGTPVIAESSEYDTYKDLIQEGVGGGNILIKNGENVMDPTNTNKMPRSCVGITADGQIVMIVVDGRQEPFSAGATYYEIAQIMLDAGCVTALELDGGGSATFDSKAEGSDEITLVNRPCDTVERSVSGSLMVVSTSPYSTEFDHAVITAPTNYLTVGSSFELELVGVSSSGHAAVIPENAVLQVSDETIGSIEGNTFTALARGTVEVQLVVDGNVVGAQTLEVIRRPDALKYTGNNLNLIYGVAEELPLVATYQNSPVTINANDIIYELSNETAGTMDGFAFMGNEESGIRNVTVTAKVRTDVNITASISLRLYSSDESIFDFDNATAGSEALAWNRDVVNTYTRDNSIYYVLDEEAGVYANYTFALDMKAIKAPARLQPLMEYLNGFADVGDNASPWDYMLALGNRVSTLTNVTIQATFPEGVEVDLSDLTFVNDFMAIKGYTYDEATRTLTASCGWIKQSSEEGIDPSTANSIAILSGVKLIPTDEALAAGQLSVDVSGSVTYDIYLDTSQLHAFAKDPANQEAYGIYDYINPDDPEDAGGHFADTYVTFEDHFTVNNQALSGWITGGADNDLHYYYIDNVMVTGVCLAPDMEGSDNSYYYNFGDDGICVGKYTGLFYDQAANGYRYTRFGELITGWVQDNDVDYYIDPATGLGANGKLTINYIPFNFSNGQVLSGVWVRDPNGYRYWYGPSYYKKFSSTSSGVYEIDGSIYIFGTLGYRKTGIVSDRNSEGITVYYECAADGKAILYSGVYGDYFYINGVKQKAYQLVEFEGNYYYISDGNKVVKGQRLYLSKALEGTPLTAGYYYFDAEGRMEINNGPVGDYFYVNGTKQLAYQLVEFEGNYYYISDGNKIVKDQRLYLSKVLEGTSLSAGYYYFDAEGRMEINNGPVGDYFYINGVKQKAYQLVEFEGNYYYISDGNKIVKDQRVYLSKVLEGTPLAAGYYYFDAEGKMEITDDSYLKNGPVGDYFYINGVKQKAYQLVEFKGNYYYISDGHKLAKNQRLYLAKALEGTSLTAGYYYFDAEGRMEINNGPVGDYFYVNGAKQLAYQLVEFEGNYYYISDGHKLAKNQRLYLAKALEGTQLKKGYYYFDADGKMEITADSYIKNGPVGDYFYINGTKQLAYQIVEFEGNYYYISDGHKLVKSKKLYLAKALLGTILPDGAILGPGYYEFDETGKIIFN